MINKKYDIGEFDTLVYIQEITAHAGINNTPVLTAQETHWSKIIGEKNNNYEKDNKESYTNTFDILLRRYTYKIKPQKFIVTIQGTIYEVVKVEQIGRRLYTKLSLINYNK